MAWEPRFDLSAAKPEEQAIANQAAAHHERQERTRDEGRYEPNQDE
jgi:hypothetical protein